MYSIKKVNFYVNFKRIITSTRLIPTGICKCKKESNNTAKHNFSTTGPKQAQNNFYFLLCDILGPLDVQELFFTLFSFMTTNKKQPAFLSGGLRITSCESVNDILTRQRNSSVVNVVLKQ